MGIVAKIVVLAIFIGIIWLICVNDVARLQVHEWLTFSKDLIINFVSGFL